MNTIKVTDQQLEYLRDLVLEAYSLEIPEQKEWDEKSLRVKEKSSDKSLKNLIGEDFQMKRENFLNPKNITERMVK